MHTFEQWLHELCYIDLHMTQWVSALCRIFSSLVFHTLACKTDERFSLANVEHTGIRRR